MLSLNRTCLFDLRFIVWFLHFSATCSTNRKRKFDIEEKEKNLTVTMPSNTKADKQTSKPVKLKRNSYDPEKSKSKMTYDKVK